MPTIISSSTEQEMIATFLRGELGSSRFRVSLEEALAKLGLTTKVVECPNLDDDPENEARRELLVTYRGWGQEESLFGGLPVDSIEWSGLSLLKTNSATVSSLSNIFGRSFHMAHDDHSPLQSGSDGAIPKWE